MCLKIELKTRTSDGLNRLQQLLRLEFEKSLECANYGTQTKGTFPFVCFFRDIIKAKWTISMSEISGICQPAKICSAITRQIALLGTLYLRIYT